MSEDKKKQKPRPLLFYWFLAGLFSILLHFVVLYELGQRSKDIPTEVSSLPEGYIKLNIPDKKELSKETKKEDEEKEKRILETPLAPTEEAPDAEFLGQNDHKAKKLMKVKEHEDKKAADPGHLRAIEKKAKLAKPSVKREQGSPEAAQKNLKHDKGFLDDKKEGRKGYEQLLADSTEQLSSTEMNQGYMDHLNDLVEEGETIDMNTKEYRFIGYFTNLRKAIELVWTYPSEAVQKGQYGKVIVKFIIQADGKVSKAQVLESSGYPILDSAILDAIRAAAPFAPLPKGFNKDHLLVRGAFSYVLGNY